VVVIAQSLGDPIPIAGMVTPSMDQCQKRFLWIAPINIMKLETLGVIGVRRWSDDVLSSHATSFLARIVAGEATVLQLYQNLTESHSVDMVWIMSDIQIQSIHEPFNDREVAQLAMDALKRVAAMGLLPQGETIHCLDAAAFQKIARGISQAGIGQGLLADLTRVKSGDTKRLSATLQQLNDVLDASPVPSYEWPGLAKILGVDLVARLVGISPSSVRRYLAGTRSTPDDVAARVHFLALVVGDLAGAYNDIGIRRWFERPRTLLGNRSPAQILARQWRPEGREPRLVRQLAQSLTASPAT